VVRAYGNADFLLETGCTDPPGDWTTARLQAVTAADVARAARQVLSSYTTAVAW
jgi:hypothetical protein